MNRYLKYVLGLFGAILLSIVLVFVVSLFQVYRFWFQQPSEDVAPVSFEVPAGSSLVQVSASLDDHGLVASPFWFKVYAVLAGEASSLQAGQYTLLPGQNYATLIGQLQQSIQDEVQVTIPEGYTIAQIGGLVTETFDISLSEWDEMVGMNSPLESHAFVIQADKPENVDLEGYLFPDTYRFFADADAEIIVRKLIDTMQQREEAIVLDDPDHSGLASLHDVLTLASIVQREVRNPDEMAMVADIFLKRLEIGMPLQADSTVNYITGKDTPAISLTDRDIESPYNTYQNAGLPPGPISNPGLDAIEAVLHPIENPYYYFLTTESGEVKYAETHDQHVQNKNLYLR